MTEPDTKQTVAKNDAVPPEPETEATGTEGEGDAPPPPEPEPWTPESVSQWNAYYDRYVMGAALVLALVVACNYATDSRIFLHLRAGQHIGEQKTPLTTDEFSYTEEGKPWVNVSWLFQWSHAALYNAVYNFVPVNPDDLTANRPKADRIAVGALGLLDAVVRLLTAWMILKLRHRGPGLWWSAICVTLALGVFYDPEIGLAPGGLASVPWSSLKTTGILPSSWGQLFLALELLIAFRAFDQGRPRYLWWLIPLFALWANWDVSFLTGLVLLAAIVLGHWLDGGALSWPEAATDETGLLGKDQPGDESSRAPARRPVPISTAGMVLGLCALACLVNPWTFRVYPVALHPFIQLIWPSSYVRTQSFFAPGVGQLLRAFYLILVAVGVASFVLNAARFSWRRFLPFAVVSLLWGCLLRYNVDFALVFAAVIALNGQEWYLARFGREGRLGAGWTLWSTGGRVVTLILIFLMVGIDITGYHVYKPGVHFGLGYNPAEYPMEAAEYLERQNELRGNVFNTLPSQGDLLVWKAFPKRKTFVDNRASLFPRELSDDWYKIKTALRDDDEATWKPLLDRYNITAVMIEPADSQSGQKTYFRLIDERNWIPFYDDGRVVMFGRKDAPAADLAFFTANRLEPGRVYRVSNPVPPVSGPPTPTSWMDEIFQNRNLDRSQITHSQAAWRWLRVGPNDGGPVLPDPARCLLAIQEARTALSRNADDMSAFRILIDAYGYLTVQENALLAGIPLTPENRQRILMSRAAPDRLMNRFRQRVAALNFAIQTTPPPETDEGREDLFKLHIQLFELYMTANFADLARDQLKAALASNPPDTSVPREAKIQMHEQLNQLENGITQLSQKMDELEIDQQPRAVDLAMYARQQGAVGMAIAKLAQADESGDSPAVVKPLLLDLYCATGQPDKALDMLNVGAIGDPNLGTEPGMATYRQALVFDLIGNYRSAASLLERSILQVRMDRSNKAVMAAKSFVRGEALQATNQFLGIPTSVEQQASWEFDLAMCLLEGGEPAEAADHFTKALNLEPNLVMRPIAAYYLEKIGKPVPPRREAAGSKKSVAADANVSVPGAATVAPAQPPLDAAGSTDARAKAAAPPEPAKVSPAEKPAAEKVPVKKP